MKTLDNYFHHIFARHVFVIITAVALLAVLGISFSQVAFADDPSVSNAQRLVTIHDNGQEMTVLTRALTIRGALEKANVVIEKNDIVEPSLDEKLIAKSYQVNVFRARPIVVIDGTKHIRVMTAEQSPRQMATSAGVDFFDEDTATLKRVNDVLAGGGAGVQMTIRRAIPFSFTLYGKQFVARTQAKTVGQLLTEKGVTLGNADGVSPSKETSITPGMQVIVWRDGKQTVTQEEAIARPVEEVKDADRDFGVREVREAGADGKRNVTYQVEIKDGVEVSRVEIASVTTLEPVKTVVLVGAKFKGAYTTPTQNELITWDFLTAQGFSRVQTAGIMGNLKQEHGFNTTGDGLAQWTGGRKATLMSLPDPYNINTQLNFLMHELNGGYSVAKNAILASSTVEAAVVAFQNKFEKCGICMESRRVQYAYDILASH